MQKLSKMSEPTKILKTECASFKGAGGDERNGRCVDSARVFSVNQDRDHLIMLRKQTYEQRVLCKVRDRRKDVLLLVSGSSSGICNTTSPARRI